HLRRRTHVKILLRASEPRAKWMMANELSEFGNDHDVDIEPVLAKDFDEVHDKLNDEAKKPSGILLSDLIDEYSDDLRGEKALRPLSDGAEPEDIAPALDEYIPQPDERRKAEA